ncbi:MAG TPA: CidA/LrgA family protein [Xanthobacteraceae bacterium]|nr:CidA/LrgA family protein [Xanthobacteraceae bacterium]
MRDFAIILGAQLVGETLQRVGAIPIPGPVLGLIFLLLLLIVRGGPWGTLGTSARGLLQHFPVLFVPAGVGVAAHFELIQAEWMPIAASVVGSSIVAILVTAWTMRAVERWRERRAAASRLSLSPPEAEHRK